MNERIKELAHKAGLPTYNPECIPTKLDMFAELLVRECIDAVYDDGQDAEYYQNRIKKHFGVEE